jgi:D-amino-acid dehydrogenase
MVTGSLRTLHHRDSALYVRPRASAALARFLVGFAWSSRRRAFAAGVSALGSLGRDAVSLYRELAAAGIELHINDRPYLVVHATRAAAQAGRDQTLRWSPAIAASTGDLLTQDELNELEPCLSGGVYGYRVGGQITIDPSALIDGLVARLREDGVEIREGARVTAVGRNGAGARVHSTQGRVDADVAVLAAGVWTTSLARTVGARVPIFPGKGYSFRVAIDQSPRHLIGLEAAHVAVAPRADGGTRIAGTMELDCAHDRFDERRVEAIVAAARPYLRGVAWERRTAEWMGPRPMTPNGLPLIGALDRARRIFVAAGHNMLGVTLAPTTGRALAELIVEGDSRIDLRPFTPRVQAA